MEIINAIFEAVTTAVSKIAESLVSGAEALMFHVPVPEGPKELTTLAFIVFTLAGLSIGFALVKWILGLVKMN